MAGNINVILARDVPNLGRIGELANVRPGYARNYLIPQGLAMPASTERVAEFEHKKRIIEHKRRTLRAASEERAKELAKVQVTLTAKVGEQNKLFGSIGNRDISAALKAEGHDIHHKDIKLEGPLKTIGLHVIDVRLEADVTSQIKVVIAAEEPPPDEVDDFDDDDDMEASDRGYEGGYDADELGKPLDADDAPPAEEAAPDTEA